MNRKPFLAFLLIPLVSLVTPVAWSSYELSPNEERLYELARSHSGQKRGAMLLDPRLCAAARSHALDMVTRNFYGHTSPEGVGPNERAKRAGYPLPKWYHQHLDANNIESYFYGSGSWNSPEIAFDWFMKSPVHRSQLLADASFTAAQTVVGVGYAINPRTGVGGYVFLSCHPFDLPRHPAPSVELTAFSPRVTAVAKGLQAGELYNLQISRDAIVWETIDAFVADKQTAAIALDSKFSENLLFLRLVSPLR